MKKISNNKATNVEEKTCGIVMPISGDEDYPAEHWLDVRHILEEAIEDAGFTPQMVCEAEDIGIIQKRIIQNLYTNPIVVCDFSSKNPNVMFELGMRLAFDKPTIIVKDDKTDYSFDTSVIEHLEYPRDLRFPSIVEFERQLSEKIEGTYKAATNDTKYSTFLKNFGTFTIPILNTQQISKEEYIIEQIQDIKRMLSSNLVSVVPKTAQKPTKNICVHKCTEEQFSEIISKLKQTSYLPNPLGRRAGENHYHISLLELSEADKLLALDCAKTVIDSARLL